MNKLLACSTGAINCAKQIVREAFNDILCGKFNVPSHKEMEDLLKDYIDYDFDEYQQEKKVIAQHPSWDDDHVKDEIHRLKERSDKEYQGNLRQAASETIAEIESLIASLKYAIKTWRIKNLE